MSKKNDKVDGLFVILFGPLILKIVSPLDPHSLIARQNPVRYHKMFPLVHIRITGPAQGNLIVSSNISCNDLS